MTYFSKRKLNNPNGFTLAEVLITLVIIGIIAAMTIPTLMKNTQKQEFVTGLKKANSVLSQGLINMANNNDSTAGDFTFLNNVNFIDEFAKVTNTVKICNSFADCFGPHIQNTSNFFHGLNNSAFSLSVGKSLITTDGQLFSYYQLRSGDGFYGISTEDQQNAIGRVIVDVNGHSGPNCVGRDVFFFYVVNGKGIIPAGLTNYETCQTSSTGRTCAARVLKENAMNY